MSRRIYAALLAVTLAVLVGLCLPLGFSNAGHDRRLFCMRAAAAAEAYAGEVESSLRGGNADNRGAQPLTPALLPRPVRDNMAGKQSEPDTVELYDASVRLVARSGPPTDVRRDALVSAAQGGQRILLPSASRRGRIMVTTSVRGTDGGVVGVVAIARSDATLQEEIARRWAAIGIGGGATALAALLIAVALTRWVARPLRHMERAVEELGAGRLAARVRPVQGPAEVRHLAAAFDTMAARIESLVDGQRAFLGDVSHQLRTPLAAMRLRLELLAQDVDDAEAAQLIGVLAEVARLSRMVDGLLAVARAEHAPVGPSSVDAATVVEDRVVSWLPIAEQDGVELGCDVGPELTVMATPGHLEQVLDNLISNALKAASRGGQVEVIGTLISPAMVRVSVVDDGPGMSREQRDAAFDRYHSAVRSHTGPGGSGNARADRGGSGLGLTIVHTLVTADHGRVVLDEAPSGGLLAAVELPTATASLPAADAEGPAAS